MALVSGTRLGSYEILAPLGAGGMGEVYRARDTKLDRAVAIKILPESFAQDPERLARFEREAKTLAALNHPNIAIIHGFEHGRPAAGGPGHEIHALVMELVEGPTLAERIADGPIPLDEALPIGSQIAEAVDAAHEQGIVHRDLKPANIKVRPDGTVKVLDFGLAKMFASAAALSDSKEHQQVLNSPTITSPAMTQAGVILGTAAYMSPEQAKGRIADKRSDVWAFGCLLYEMLSGKRPFEGEDVGETLAAILRGEPDWTALPNEVPAAIRTLLGGCLTKDRRRRIAGLSAALFVIDQHAALGPRAAALETTARRAPLWPIVIAGATAITLAIAAGFAVWTLKPTPTGRLTRLAITLDPDSRFTTGGGSSIALSPDGARLAFVANNRVYLRPLDRVEATPIAGGQSAPLASPRTPFFSPDGQWIGYWEGQLLKKVSVSGGAPITLCKLAPPPNGASWAADNTILVGRHTSGIWRVSGDGGTPEQIIALDEGHRAHGPQLLPDSRTVLFTLSRFPNASWDEAEIVAHSLDTGTRKTLITGATDGRYLPTGHLIYSLRGTLRGLAFDPTTLATSGGSVALVDQVWQPPLASAAQFAVSSNGTLVYGPPRTIPEPPRTLVWVDRAGREQPVGAPPRSYGHPRLSPDGMRLAVDVASTADSEYPTVWIWDFTRGSLTRVTSDPTGNREPLWTPDGQHLIYTSRRTGEISLVAQPASGTGTTIPLAPLSHQSNVAPTISPDGRSLVIRAADQGSSYLALLDLGDWQRRAPSASSSAQAKPLLQTPFEEYNAAISPDGRWLAYTSNESGAFDIYVRPFPDAAAGRWQVSTGGGTEPVWSRDGRELFFRNPKGAVMRVAITQGASWNAGTPTELFDGAAYLLAPIGNAAVARVYDISPDGKRFLMMKLAESASQTPSAPTLVVVQNWFDELERLVPAK